MIFSELTPERKKKINSYILAVGSILLILGIIPGLLSIQWGIVFFVFSLVAAGIVKVIIPEPDPSAAPEGDGHLEKILKSGESEDDGPQK